MVRRIFRRLGMLTALILVCSLFTLAIAPHLIFEVPCAVSDWWNRIPFDSVAWKADANGQINRRYDMLADLLRKHNLVGMSEAEVKQLLGEPTMPEDWQHQSASGYTAAFCYCLGFARHSLGPDYAFLVLGYKDGKVVEIWQRSG